MEMRQHIQIVCLMQGGDQTTGSQVHMFVVFLRKPLVFGLHLLNI